VKHKIATDEYKAFLGNLYLDTKKQENEEENEIKQKVKK